MDPFSALMELEPINPTPSPGSWDGAGVGEGEPWISTQENVLNTVVQSAMFRQKLLTLCNFLEFYKT